MNEEAARRFLHPQTPALERTAAQAMFDSIEEIGYNNPIHVLNRFIIGARLMPTEDGQSLVAIIEAFRKMWTSLEARTKERLEREGMVAEPAEKALVAAGPSARRIMELDISSVAGVRHEVETVKRLFVEEFR